MAIWQCYNKNQINAVRGFCMSNLESSINMIGAFCGVRDVPELSGGNLAAAIGKEQEQFKSAMAGREGSYGIRNKSEVYRPADCTIYRNRTCRSC